MGLVRAVGRTRALLDGTANALFGILAIYITVRMISQHADVLGVILIAGLTIGLWWRALRKFRRFRELAEISSDAI